MTRSPATWEEVLRILRGSPNGANDRFSVARIIETERRAKPGSYHLAVNRAMRMLERQGRIVVRPPRDEHDSHWMALTDRRERKKEPGATAGTG